MTGFLQRQQWGYWWEIACSAKRAFFSLSLAITLGLASKTNWPLKKFDFISKTTMVIQRGIGLQAVFESGVVVLPAMTGGGVDAAGSLLQGYIRRQNHKGFPLIQRMAADQMLQFAGVPIRPGPS